ncbi:MAG: hypothetical protein LUE86_00370 [Clostridiales bacterium]|nr:hypothetical protein [Clostridiales bacterium]
MPGDSRVTHAYRNYAEANPDLTPIKLAENFSFRNGLHRFYRRTATLILGLAVALLAGFLIVLSALSFRTMTRPEINQYAFQSSIRDIAESRNDVQEIVWKENDSYYVYMNASLWESYSTTQQDHIYQKVSASINDSCHACRILPRDDVADVYFFDTEGSLLMEP